jgi:hypothetical protein
MFFAVTVDCAMGAALRLVGKPIQGPRELAKIEAKPRIVP